MIFSLCHIKLILIVGFYEIKDEFILSSYKIKIGKRFHVIFSISNIRLRLIERFSNMKDKFIIIFI